jgi:hypothetical protein
MQKITNSILIFLIVTQIVSAQKYTISGYITDSNSGERLIGANIYDLYTLSGTVSNNYGFYSLRLSGGPVDLATSYMGYNPLELSFVLSADTTINFSLEISTVEIEGITILGRASKVESTQMSMIDIPVEKFRSLPVLLGEADVLKGHSAASRGTIRNRGCYGNICQGRGC